MRAAKFRFRDKASEPYFGGIPGAYSFHRSGCDFRVADIRVPCLCSHELRHGFKQNSLPVAF